MSALVIEEAFVQEVDLMAEVCANPDCGLALGLSTDHVGAIADVDDGVPVALMWHLECAPRALRVACRG